MDGHPDLDRAVRRKAARGDSKARRAMRHALPAAERRGRYERAASDVPMPERRARRDRLITVGERVDFPASFHVADPAARIASLEFLLERLAFEAARIDTARPAVTSSPRGRDQSER